jgi:CubicO group peptidase (beta-lactamase class C family)
MHPFRAILCVLLLSAADAPAQRLDAAPATASEDPLVGLWVAQVRFGPAVKGRLDLRRRGPDWEAAIGPARQAFAAQGRQIRFALPGGTGSFRGLLAADGRTIDGFWTRPSGETEGRQNAVGAGQSFTTPVVLTRAGTNLWRGEVAPLEDRFTGYIHIAPEEDGLGAALRNPELNLNGGVSRFRVERNGDTIRFTFSNEDFQVAHQARLLRDPDRISIAWPELGQTLELARADPVQAAAYFPRPPGGQPYVYRRPEQMRDGWATARAGDVGLDEAALTRLVQGLIDADPSARGPSLIHSLLVARDGRLVVEEYFFGQDRETTHDIRSAGKTFSSVLLGVAMRNGAPISPESRVYELMRGRGPFANPDPRKQDIRLWHLMTHSAGLACDDNDEESPGNEETMWRQKAQPDFWKHTLDLPMLHAPGTRYAYCSANINLAGGAITQASGAWLPLYFHEQVALPLQFGRYHWNVARNGEGYLGGGAFLRPRDLLKIGQAYLDGGTWHRRRIVDAAWIGRSTAPLIEINERTTGLSAEQFGNFYGRGEDALAWHLLTLNAGGRVYRGYQASGNGGQILLVIPELRLTAVITGGNYRQGGIWSRWPQRLIGDQIIPALRP